MISWIGHDAQANNSLHEINLWWCTTAHKITWCSSDHHTRVYLFFNVAFSLFTVMGLLPTWPWGVNSTASMHTGAWLVSHRGQLAKGSRRSCHTAEINKFQGKASPVGCPFWKLPFQVDFKVPLAEVLFFSIIDPLAICSFVPLKVSIHEC